LAVDIICPCAANASTNELGVCSLKTWLVAPNRVSQTQSKVHHKRRCILDNLSVDRKRRLRLSQANYTKGLILAQNERWRRGLGMQVEREPARGRAANGVGRIGDVPFGRG